MSRTISTTPTQMRVFQPQALSPPIYFTPSSCSRAVAIFCERRNRSFSHFVQSELVEETKKPSHSSTRQPHGLPARCWTQCLRRYGRGPLFRLSSRAPLNPVSTCPPMEASLRRSLRSSPADRLREPLIQQRAYITLRASQECRAPRQSSPDACRARRKARRRSRQVPHCSSPVCLCERECCLRDQCVRRRPFASAPIP